MPSRFLVGSGTTWSSTASWSATSGGGSGASVPVSTDDVFSDANSPGNCTITASTSVQTLDCTGVTGLSPFTHTLTQNAAVALTVTGNKFKLVAGMTYTPVNATTSSVLFTDAIAETVAITTAGKTLSNVTTASGLTSSSATYQLQDACTLNSSALWTHTAGTFDTNNKAFSVGRFGSSNTNTRTVTLGSSVITITGGGTTSNWAMTNTTALTFNAGTSAITVNGAYTGAGGFFDGGSGAGAGGVTFYDVTFSHTGTIELDGSNSYHTLTFSPGVTVKVQAGKTHTPTSLVVTGTAGNVITLSSTTPGSAYSLSVFSGQVSGDYLSLTDCQAIGGGQFFAGAHSTDGGGNVGWRFTAPDRTPGPAAMLAFMG